MRILVISNLYPPHLIGGYELGCKDIVEGLRDRGHEVAVLTSTYRVGRRQQQGNVFRWLSADSSLRGGSSTNVPSLLKKEFVNRRAFDRVCRIFNPDLVYIWNMTGISISLAFRAQGMGLPTSYFISDDWLTRWEADAFYSLTYRQPSRLFRRLLLSRCVALLDSAGVFPRGELELSNAQFASRFLKEAALDAGREVSDARVIHWGIDLERFRFNDQVRTPKRILYVGQLASHKGVDTAIEALNLLQSYSDCRSVTLSIAGGPDYGENTHRLACRLGIDSKVQFLGLLPRDELPAVYRDHDIFVFPSAWEEPFSIALLEAMASGLAVVGTLTGGTGEVLADEVNGLVFKRNDPRACADQIARLVRNPPRFHELRQKARSTVENRFGLDRMLDQIEVGLIESTTPRLRTLAAGAIR